MEIAAGLFKAQCLKLMDRVAERHETITVTKRGKAVARLVPVESAPERPLFGFGLNNTTWLLDWIPSLSGGAFVLNTATPESAYIAALVETGVVGFGALMLFIIIVVVRAYRNAQAARTPALDIGICAAVVAILCGSLTVVGLTTDQNGMLLGALSGLIFSTANSQ